jgi:cyclase
MDVVASLYGRNSLLEIVEKTSKQIFIPLTVGGGLRTLDDIQRVLRAGADKVSLNTATIKNPEIIKKASKKFGSSTIMVSIEAIKKSDGSYEAYTENGRQETGLDPFKWAVRVAEMGAGEIMLTSIDREGTGESYDIELTKGVAESVQIPVIACGGAGTAEHVSDAIVKGKADAVSMASILHYNFIRHNNSKEDFSTEGNIEYLQSGRGFSKIQGATIQEIKKYLIKKGIECRF